MLDEGRYYIETSPMDCFLYDKDLRHERFLKYMIKSEKRIKFKEKAIWINFY